jgi:hypothetical protein
MVSRDPTLRYCSALTNISVVVGGDIGSLTARFVAQKYGPEHCKAHLLLGAVPAEPTAETHPELHTKMINTPLFPAELESLARTAHFDKEHSGYLRLQSTKPLTIGYSLTDSPIGLLAWIYEKLINWTDSYPWTDDEILTWVSIYYFSTAGPAASVDMFYEMQHREPRGAFEESQKWCDVPVGVARYPKEVIQLPKLWNQTLGPVVWEGEHERGGHFPAWECPESVLVDVRRIFGAGGGADAWKLSEIKQK